MPTMEVGEEDETPNQIKTQQPFNPQNEEEDRISLLPDSLIIDEILSRLETKDAIKTGTLSKRWQHLWPFVPSLFFYDSYINGYLNFHLIIDETLTKCQLKNLRKFQVVIDYYNRFESHLENWINFAISSNVQHLDLYLRGAEDEEDRFVLEDDSFFINSHFTHLDLGGFIFNPSGSINWNNLTHLSICYGEVDDDLIANVLSGSPLLDTLTLVSCYGYSLLDITSKSVKNLVLCGYGYNPQFDELDDIVYIIDINAPYISSLTITGDLLNCEISLHDVSSLVKSELSYTKVGYDKTTRETEREEMLKGLLLCLKHVKELKIGTSCNTVFSRLEAKGFVFPSNLKVVPGYYSAYDNDSTELGDCSDNDSSESVLST